VGFPFSVREVDSPDGEAAALFQRAFRARPPNVPRHFVAMFAGPDAERVAGYVHYMSFDDGVYLIGGLCVDARVYRKLDGAQRARVAGAGSLSRCLLEHSIAALGSKRAVFAYTGDTRSRRDAFALGFVPTGSRFLLVQWHDARVESRDELIRRVGLQGPF
jgi:hypothetical protein